MYYAFWEIMYCFQITKKQKKKHDLVHMDTGQSRFREVVDNKKASWYNPTKK